MKHLFFALTTLLISSVTQAHIQVAPTVDLKAYMGTWYEIARLPNSFEEKCKSNVTAEYTLREDGEIDVVNSCDTFDGERSVADGLAWKPNPDEPTKLKVSFVPFLKRLHLFGGDYWIFDVDESKYALVGSPDLDYLWILSRTPELDVSTIDKLLELMIHMGVETKYLIFTKQDNT